MSDETENTENNSETTEAKSNEDKSSLIGVDPLAWLSEEEKASVINENNITASAEENSTLDESAEKLAEQTDTPCYIKLQSAISIRNITELMDELNNINPDETELIFECDQVDKVDAAALQLLLGFYLFSIEAGKTVVWNNPSDAFCHGVELLGMRDIINLPAVAA